jgi:hypothetical protein
MSPSVLSRFPWIRGSPRAHREVVWPEDIGHQVKGTPWNDRDRRISVLDDRFALLAHPREGGDSWVYQANLTVPNDVDDAGDLVCIRKNPFCTVAQAQLWSHESCHSSGVCLIPLHTALYMTGCASSYASTLDLSQGMGVCRKRPALARIEHSTCITQSRRVN